MPELAFLWTDVLIWLLVLLVSGFGLAASRHEHLREPWRRVMRSRTGVASALVLSVFVVTGLLDSVHFRPVRDGGDTPTGEVLSLFDVLVTPLRTRQEKTYSSPLATHLFAKETFDLPDGTQTRGFPRLVYGGAHLADPEADRATDLLVTTLQGTVAATLTWLVIAVAIAWATGRGEGGILNGARRLWRQAGGFPWRTFFLVSGIVLLVIWVTALLGTRYHLLGTDKVGEDVFYQALKSIRTGLVIGTLTTLVMLPAAIFLGIAAGYFRGGVDDIIQYLYTTLNSIPGVLLIAAAVLMLQVYMDNNADQFSTLVERADMRLLFLCMILGITSWTGLCRLLRGETLKLRELDYVEAAHGFGVGHFTILGRHIVPNVLHIVLISVVLDFSGRVLAEAVLSYVNIGVDPTTHSWGNMINSARLELAREPIVWWSLAAAMIFMFTLVLAANLFSDVVRDAFDPRLRQQ